MPEKIAKVVADDVPAEEMLRRERDRMRSVLEGMGEAFVLLGHDFAVLDINAEGLKLETRGRDEIVGRSHWDVWPNTKGSAIGRLYEHAMAAREPVSLEHRYQWPDGREHWIDMRAYPVPDGLAPSSIATSQIGRWPKRSSSSSTEKSPLARPSRQQSSVSSLKA